MRATPPMLGMNRDAIALLIIMTIFTTVCAVPLSAQPESADAPTTPAAAIEQRTAPMPAPAATQLTHQQYVYHHFFVNYEALRLLPQFYEDIFSFHGRIPAKRWLDFYNEQLTAHEGAFYHLYEMVGEPGYALNDLVSTGPLFGLAPRHAAMIDIGAERAQVYSRLGLMYGDIFLARGDHERAFECYGLVVRMTRLDPESPLLLHLISLQLRQLAYNHMAMAMDAFAGAPAGSLAPSVRTVLEGLRDDLASYRPIEEQHKMEALLRAEVRDLWQTLDHYDPPAEPLPAGSVREVWKATLDRWQPVWESGRIPNEIQVVSGTRRLATLQSLLAEIENLQEERLFVRDFSAATRRDVLNTRITLAHTFWKLLYLETVAILDPINGRSLANLRKIIPADLYPYMMLDPFTGLVFGSIGQQSGARAHFYSFGPDRDDDAAKVRYNPENGLVSDGDIPLFY